MDNPKLRKGLDAITSSLNHIGDTFEKAFEVKRPFLVNSFASLVKSIVGYFVTLYLSLNLIPLF